MILFIAGDGKTELGDWSEPPQYRAAHPRRGCLEALVSEAAGPHHEIAGSISWKNIRSFQAGQHRSKELRNVLGAALHAKDAGCEALVFVRDRDRRPECQVEIESGLREAEGRFAELKIAGGVAIEEIEAWILACRGERKSEAHRDAKAALGPLSTQDKVAVIDSLASFSELPDDAHSLKLWVSQVRARLGAGSTP